MMTCVTKKEIQMKFIGIIEYLSTLFLSKNITLYIVERHRQVYIFIYFIQFCFLVLFSLQREAFVSFILVNSVYAKIRKIVNGSFKIYRRKK